ncbi:condensin complex subunit 3 [Achlya hypogyna]|uniref:Condensin complex subunit 3 n=1 Tax=Achlya hypogyna TaxID=1202772 RepID=A0A1V9YIS4_ACHHY|nr:condensin complex subunit 3 [Achlya hypogyna]
MAGAEGSDIREELHEILGAIVEDAPEHDGGFLRAKHLASLQDLYDGGADAFVPAVQLALVRPFKDDRRGRVAADIDRLLEVVSAVKYSTEDHERMLRFAIRGSEAEDKSVRARSTQFTGLLISAASTITDAVRPDVTKAMLRRAHDKLPAIRKLSVLALRHLQRPSVEDIDTVTTTVLRLAVTDPSAEVRIAAVDHVAVHATSVGDLLIRVRDIKPEVRTAVFRSLASADTTAILSPSDRVHVLDQGLHDRDEAVVAACHDLVLAWLRAARGSPIEVLATLDTEKAPEVCAALCRWLLQHHADALVVANVKDRALLGEDLSVAETFFWKEQCAYLQAADTDALDALLPAIPAYCDLLRHLQHSLADADDAAKATVVAVGKHVLELGLQLDFQDEVGRRLLVHLLRECLGNCSFEGAWLPGAVRLLATICRATEFEFVQYMTEITSDLFDAMQEMPALSPETRAELTRELDAVDEQLEDPALSVAAYDALHAQALALEAQLEEPRTLQWLRCLELTAQLLRLTRQTLGNATIAGVLHMILPAVDSDIPALRERGLECLGLYCLLDRAMAAQHAIVFWRVLNADDEDGDAKDVCIQVLLDFFTGFKQLEIPPFVEDGETVTAAGILKGLATYFCTDQRELDEWDVPTQTLVVRGFIKLYLLQRLDDVEILQQLLELYFHPFLKQMVHAAEHGFCSETLQMLSVFYPAVDCALVHDACHHVLSRALYGVSHVPFTEAAAYLLALLEHPPRDGRCHENHHNRVARWVCVEMLALHEVKHVVTKKDKLGFLSQWWTLLHELKWTVAASDDDDVDDDAPIRPKATAPADAPTPMANDTADAHATDAPTTEATDAPPTGATDTPTMDATDAPTMETSEAPTTEATDALTTNPTETADEPMDGEDTAPSTPGKAAKKTTEAPEDETPVASDAKEAAVPDEAALLFVLFDEVCQLMPDAAAFRAKMATAFGATTYALTDATSDWILAAVAARKDVLAQAEYKKSIQKRAGRQRAASDSDSDCDSVSDNDAGRKAACPTPQRAKSTRASKSSAAAKLRADAASSESEPSVVEIDDDSSDASD